MKYLLDTHTFIWTVLDTSMLPDRVMEIIENPRNEIYVSSLSFWEISIKTRLRKMDFRYIDIRHLPNIARQYNFKILESSPYDMVCEGELPYFKEHKDPFDRMLISLAIRHNLILLSKDKQFDRYIPSGLQLLWD
ncbi:MAG: type II toxin-antitoxin system VapC family toxin [Spirochaetales bacterium]|nr:type II toxin-antitoxin system VapC family toxin [Spirochaetales bacterium]